VRGEHRPAKVVQPLAVLVGQGHTLLTLADHRPARGDGVQDEHLTDRHSGTGDQPQPREIVLDYAVVLPPRVLVTERRRKVALAAAADRVKSQVLAAQVDAQDVLPVSHPLLPLESELPGGAAVSLRQHPLAPELMGDTGRLLDGQVLVILLGEHVDPGHVLMPQVRHDGPAPLDAQPHLLLKQKVPGKGQPILLAPVPELARVGVLEPLGDGPPVVVPRLAGTLALEKEPRQHVEQVVAPAFAEERR